ncbi:hypothetical protein SD81_040215 [Tolypothrix campylonemoides VB511288]|nr:hypothetical protein SD81_040215 [Tolypothrix campylonemoides VB511288]
MLAVAPGAAAARARGSTVLDVRRFGAKGDGIADDTAAFQRAIDALPEAGGTVRVPDGDYRIDPLRSVRLRSRMHLQLAPGARLHAIPNAAERAYVLNAHGVRDVEISGGRILGERHRHLGTRGEWGHGLMVRGCTGVTVRDLRIDDCWGDGISIGGIDAPKGRAATPSRDVVVQRVRCIGNRRQGLTIGRSQRVRVSDCEFADTGGTPPAAGIDVEPDAGHVASDVRIERCHVHGNAGPGIQFYKRVRGAVVADCTIENNRGPGLLLLEATDIMLVGNRVRGHRGPGLSLRRGAGRVVLRDNAFSANGSGRAKAAKPNDDAIPSRHVARADGAFDIRIEAGNTFQ